MLLNENLLRNYAHMAKQMPLRESVLERGMVFDAAIQYDLFVSHSFKDKDLVLGLYHLFTVTGYKVYIDWIDDPKLNRKNVTAATAEIIKERISNSKGTAYIATSNSTDSKWCPWELGVADGLLGRVCILPVMEQNYFYGQEYLGLYPYLDYVKIEGKTEYEFWVNDQNDNDYYISLREWLKGKNPCKH